MTTNLWYPANDQYCPTFSIVPGKPHMGEPESFGIVLNWIYKLFGIRANPMDQIKTLPFQPKYSS